MTASGIAPSPGPAAAIIAAAAALPGRGLGRGRQAARQQRRPRRARLGAAAGRGERVRLAARDQLVSGSHRQGREGAAGLPEAGGRGDRGPRRPHPRRHDAPARPAVYVRARAFICTRLKPMPTPFVRISASASPYPPPPPPPPPTLLPSCGMGGLCGAVWDQRPRGLCVLRSTNNLKEGKVGDSEDRATDAGFPVVACLWPPVVCVLWVGVVRCGCWWDETTRAGGGGGGGAATESARLRSSSVMGEEVLPRIF